MATTNAYRMTQDTIEYINAERKYQVQEKGYTREFDDTQMPHQFIDYIKNYLQKCENAKSPEEFLRMLVKVTALGVAAIEAHDRAVH